jgi:hypothetical protein
MLCAQCRKVIHEAETIKPYPPMIQAIPWNDLPHNNSLAGFQAACKNNCYVCSRLKSKSLHLLNGATNDDAFKEGCSVIPWYTPSGERAATAETIDVAFWLEGRTSATRLELQLGQPRARDSIITLRFLWNAQEHSIMQTFRAQMLHFSIRFLPTWCNPYRSTRFKTVLDQASIWLDSCRHTHVKCFAHSQPSKRTKLIRGGPKRLIDIKPQGLEKNMWRIHEVESDGWIQDDYITLSHRWAKPEPLKLTADSHKAMREGLPIQDLPVDYQDAVHVASHLGVRYLWIDSICMY